MYNDIKLTIQSDKADIEYVADQVQRLRSELLDGDIENVRQVTRGNLPEGAKSLEPIDWGALSVTIASVGGGVFAFLSLIGSWTQRNQGNEISLTLPNGASLTVKGNIAKREDFAGFVDMVQRAMHEGPEPAGSTYVATNSLTLREKMISFLSIEEVKSICFDLGIDHENLEHDKKSSLVRTLLEYAQRQGMVEDVREKCAKVNPKIDWLE
ncbi:MAG: hypothetical protein AAGD96_17530 [Chloroflexota bacterium]